MTAKTMPTWLADQLIADGVMNQARITRTAKPRTCPHCHAPVLAAIDDIVAHRINLDPIPVNALGEAVAILTGRTTYGIFYGEPVQRDSTEIAYRPADIRPIYATHHCHAPPLPPETKFIALTRPTPTADDLCPF